jgi:hypothetical protein
MMLLVEVPPGRLSERAYVLDVLLGDMLGLDHQIRETDRADTRIGAPGAGDGRAITIPEGLFSTPDDQWLTAASLPREPLARLRAPDKRADPEAATLPAPFGVAAGAQDGPALIPEAGEMRIRWDLLGSAFFLLSRYEEVAQTGRDEHARFPASLSMATREAFLDRPVVDEYGDVLRAAVSACWPGLPLRQARYRVQLSHDVDRLWAARGLPWHVVLRHAAGDVVVRRDGRLAGRRLLARLGGRRPVAAALDPYSTFFELMEVSERHGLRSAFYLLAQPDGTPFAAPYELSEPATALLVATLAARGHELGLHGSYAAMRDPVLLRDELRGLERLAERLGLQQSRWGGRQHYLRWEAPTTWRAWDAAGLDYDASAGFAQQPGFRTGTCREHRVYDLVERRTLSVRARPLTAMLDATLFQYLALDAATAFDRVRTLAARCRRHGGDCSLLVHNEFLAPRWARRWYSDVVEAVVAP